MVRAADDAGGLTTKSRAKVPVIKRPTKKKPKDKPKRPLSAYNYFFKEEREKIVKVVLAEDPSAVKQDPDDDGFLDAETIGRLKKEGGKVSFEEMGKIIGQRWKNIDPDRLAKYAELAAVDTERYKTEMQKYNLRQEAKMRSEALKPPVSYAAASAGPSSVPNDGRGGSAYPDLRGGYGDMPGSAAAAYAGMTSSGMASSGMGPAGMTPAGMGSAYGYGGYGDFSGYSNPMGMSAYGSGGSGMPMRYGGYPQSMDPSNAYGGGGQYGSMGMMGANGFQPGMPMGYPDQSYSGQPQQQQQQMDPQQPPGGAHGGGGYDPNQGNPNNGNPGANNPYGSGGGTQGSWGQGQG